jgi:serine/threonine protein kinase
VDDDFYEDDSIIYRGMNSNSTATTSKADRKKNSKLAMIRASIRGMVEEKVDAAIALGEAIAYLHTRRVVHRDLKPDNIGFDPHGVLKVFDFDIARVAPPPTTTQHTAAYDPDETFRMTGRVGSPRYMSPECAKKEDYNLTTDVYSYGLLCHQILTLEKPYDDIHDDDHDEYVFHRHVRPHIPQALPVPTQQILFRSWAPILAFRPTCAKFCDLLKQDRTAIIQNGVPSSSSSGSTSSMAYVSSCTFASVSDCNVVAATTATVAVATADVNKKAKKNKNSNKKMNKKLLSSFRQLLLGSGSGDKKKPLDGKSLNGTGGVPIPKILSSPTLGRQNSSNALAA